MSTTIMLRIEERYGYAKLRDMPTARYANAFEEKERAIALCDWGGRGAIPYGIAAFHAPGKRSPIDRFSVLH